MCHRWSLVMLLIPENTEFVHIFIRRILLTYLQLIVLMTHSHQASELTSRLTYVIHFLGK